MRPRIRTLKPEIWQDEKVGDLSHGARLLYVGLITMADDEGRLRELPAAITGQVFPYDGIAPARLSRWLRELSTAGLVLRYGCGDKNYLAFRKWKKHQRVDKPNESDLPPPPEDSPNGSGTDPGSNRGSISDSVADQSRPPRAGASLPIPSGPDPSNESRDESKPGEPGRKRATHRVDQSVPPDDFPADKLPELAEVSSVLHRAWNVRGGVEPSPRGVALGVLRNLRADHVQIAQRLEHWLTAGRGVRSKCGDIAARYGDWVADAEAADGGGTVRVLPRASHLEQMDAWKRGYPSEAS